MKLKTEMTLVETSDEMAPGAWDIFYLRPKIGKRVTAAFKAAFEREPPNLTLPFQWSERSDGYCGPPVEDPMTIYVALPLGAYDDDKVVFSGSLSDAIEDVFELFSSDGETTGSIADANGRDILAKMAARLRELAAKIDTALARVVEEEEEVTDA